MNRIIKASKAVRKSEEDMKLMTSSLTEELTGVNHLEFIIIQQKHF